MNTILAICLGTAGIRLGMMKWVMSLPLSLQAARPALMAGGTIFAQAPESCVIWGMPGAVAKAGLATATLNPDAIGLMLGIQTEKNASDIIAACREKGVLVIKAKDKLRLLPALNIPMEQLQKAVAVIKECCAE